MRFSALVLLIGLAARAQAAEHRLPVQDFDRVRIVGAYSVELRQGPITALIIDATPDALDATSALVMSGQLTVQQRHAAWGNSASARLPSKLIITTPHLRRLAVDGSADVHVMSRSESALSVVLVGSGSVAVSDVQATTLDLALSGSGRVTATGQSDTGHIAAEGSGAVDAAGLQLNTVSILANGVVSVAAVAAREAKITSRGAGNVTVSGNPACTVDHQGPGDVVCGR